MTSATAHKL